MQMLMSSNVLELVLVVDVELDLGSTPDVSDVPLDPLLDLLLLPEHEGQVQMICLFIFLRLYSFVDC